MKFKINDRTYTILKKSKEEMFGTVKEANKDDGKEYLGLHFPATCEIWLLKTLPLEQMKKILIHELTHCYLWCYGIGFDTFNEENVCDISANSHIIISEIINKYFGGKDER